MHGSGGFPRGLCTLDNQLVVGRPDLSGAYLVSRPGTRPPQLAMPGDSSYWEMPSATPICTWSSRPSLPSLYQRCYHSSQQMESVIVEQCSMLGAVKCKWEHVLQVHRGHFPEASASLPGVGHMFGPYLVSAPRLILGRDRLVLVLLPQGSRTDGSTLCVTTCL